MIFYKHLRASSLLGSVLLVLTGFFDVGKLVAQTVNGIPGKTLANGVWIPKTIDEMPSVPLGPFVRLDNGSILAVEDSQSLISNDEGKTWERHRIFKEGDKIQFKYHNALVKTKSGAIILAFINYEEKSSYWNPEIRDWNEHYAIRPTYTIRSLDGGKTWQDLQKLHNEYTGCIRDMIETRNGNVIFTTMMARHHPGRHAVLTYTSRDDGKTWERSNIIDLGGIGHHGGVSESTIEQLKDGRIWQLMRTNWGTFWEAFSDDEGLTWKDIKPTMISASSAPGILKRMSNGRLVLIWHRQFPEGKTHHELWGGDGQWSEVAASNFREELSMAFSDDDGKTWSKPKIIAKYLEDGSGKRFFLSYPYVFEVSPGILWVTTHHGNLRLKLNYRDFLCIYCPTN
ncbi:sialidase family protein [Parapedobacter soli]|uniref:sialidase family protein n=1 Tax=Parapedobacter soli TaxID=416955 RepID=UPI0021C6BD59|nr:sialidase family protein [Parapedobacter soli]